MSDEFEKYGDDIEREYPAPPKPPRPPGVRNLGSSKNEWFVQFCAGVVCGFIIGAYVMAVIYAGINGGWNG